jgi:hypothetical protein
MVLIQTKSEIGREKMAKKKKNQSVRALVEGISFIKSIRETAPQNPKIAGALNRIEAELHEELYEVMSETTKKKPKPPVSNPSAN